MSKRLTEQLSVRQKTNTEDRKVDRYKVCVNEGGCAKVCNKGRDRERKHECVCVHKWERVWKIIKRLCWYVEKERVYMSVCK